MTDPQLLPHAGSRTLDAAALANLRELDPDGRHGVIVRVLAAFERSLERLLPLLDAERGRGDAAAVADLAHSVKAASASVGALGLAQASAEIDRRIRSGTAGDLQADIERMVAESTAALAASRATARA